MAGFGSFSSGMALGAVAADDRIAQRRQPPAGAHGSDRGGADPLIALQDVLHAVEHLGVTHGDTAHGPGHPPAPGVPHRPQLALEGNDIGAEVRKLGVLAFVQLGDPGFQLGDFGPMLGFLGGTRPGELRQRSAQRRLMPGIAGRPLLELLGTRL